MAKPREFLGKKVCYETDIRLKGWQLVKYIRSYTNGVSNSEWTNKRGQNIFLMVYG